ncbi:MAG TPA: cold shock domain-containing protein [bacterium]|nr:cold shock domain-containing protein [bacterium]
MEYERARASREVTFMAPPSMQAKRVRGTVRWFNRVSGFGFIQIEGERDVFVQESAIRATEPRVLNEGQAVELTIVHHNGRREADDVAAVKAS